MTNQRKPTLLTPLLAIVVTLVLLFGAYMGSYYAMLEGVGVYLKPEDSPPPIYRFGHDNLALQGFLWPAHQLDRWVRPKMWTSTVADRTALALLPLLAADCVSQVKAKDMLADEFVNLVDALDGPVTKEEFYGDFGEPAVQEGGLGGSWHDLKDYMHTLRYDCRDWPVDVYVDPERWKEGFVDVVECVRVE